MKHLKVKSEKHWESRRQSVGPCGGNLHEYASDSRRCGAVGSSDAIGLKPLVSEGPCVLKVANPPWFACQMNAETTQKRAKCLLTKPNIARKHRFNAFSSGRSVIEKACNMHETNIMPPYSLRRALGWPGSPCSMECSSTMKLSLDEIQSPPFPSSSNMVKIATLRASPIDTSMRQHDTSHHVWSACAHASCIRHRPERYESRDDMLR